MYSRVSKFLHEVQKLLNASVDASAVSSEIYHQRHDIDHTGVVSSEQAEIYHQRHDIEDHTGVVSSEQAEIYHQRHDIEDHTSTTIVHD